MDRIVRVERRRLNEISFVILYGDNECIGIEPVRDPESLIDRMKISIPLVSNSDQEDFAVLFIKPAQTGIDRSRRCALLLSLYEFSSSLAENGDRMRRVQRSYAASVPMQGTDVFTS